MTCKVVGFDGKIGKSERKFDGEKVLIRVKTAEELTKDPLFVSACVSLSQAKGLPNYDSLATKRQASKFFRKEGCVYQHAVNNMGMKGGE